MAEEKKDSKSTIIIILLVLIIVIILGGVVVAFFLLHDNVEALPQGNVSVTEDATNQARPGLHYEAGAIALDADSLQKAVDEAFKKTEDGYITLDFFNEAYSTDGENFECRIGNDPSNTSDMYCTIYMNDDPNKVVYLSGLMRPGEGIASFKSKIKLEKGSYECVLTLTQVMDDHETLKAETSVVLTLFVN